MQDEKIFYIKQYEKGDTYVKNRTFIKKIWRQEGC